jgi:hypothetical protein
VAQQIHDDSRLRRELFSSRALAASPPRSLSPPSPHHVTDADVLVPEFLHQRFAERVQTRLRRAIRRAVRKRIIAREAADVDDEPAAATAQVRQRRPIRVEYAGQILCR